jgi:hypothetical protein
VADDPERNRILGFIAWFFYHADVLGVVDREDRAPQRDLLLAEPPSAIQRVNAVVDFGIGDRSSVTPFAASVRG